MFDTIVPLKSIFGTIIIFIVFVLLGITTLIAPKIIYGYEWFIVPLMIGLALCLLKCIENIREIIKLKDDEATTEKTAVYLKSCPEYWVKDTVTIGEEGNYRRIPVCKNYVEKSNGDRHYVGGSINKFGTSLANDGNDVDLGPKTNPTSLQGKFKERETTTPTEGFTNPTEFNEVRNNTDGNEDGEPRVSYKMNNKLDRGKFLTNSEKKHIHHTGPLLIHKNNATDSEGNFLHHGLQGYAWHSHDDQDTSLGSITIRDNNYSSNWINYSPDTVDPQGVEINLDYLNQADNVCELAKHFYWTEAYNKCKENNEWDF